MAIYTKTGDKGQTSLANGQRVEKTDVRIEAYGTVDELNSWIGMLRSRIKNSKLKIQNEQLAWVQNKLFNIGASLSCAPGEWITEEDVQRLEEWIDAMQAKVPPMRAFVLPSGGEVVATCHVCRTICRRAERRMWESGESSVESGESSMESGEVKFVNRLSDYLFVLARYTGYLAGEEEEKWQK